MKKNLFKLTAMALAAGLVFTTGYGLVQASDSYIPKQTPTDNTVDASTGKVKDMDIDVLKTNTKSTTSATSSITLEQAKEIALAKAELTSATFIEARFDKEDNDYDFEFHANGKEYDCEVSASDGRVKEFEVEPFENDRDDCNDRWDDDRWDDDCDDRWDDDWDDHHDDDHHDDDHHDDDCWDD